MKIRFFFLGLFASEFGSFRFYVSFFQLNCYNWGYKVILRHFPPICFWNGGKILTLGMGSGHQLLSEGYIYHPLFCSAGYLASFNLRDGLVIKDKSHGFWSLADKCRCKELIQNQVDEPL